MLSNRYKRSKQKQLETGVLSSSACSSCSILQLNTLEVYHWRELPQVSSFFCCNKTFVVTNTCLLQQTYVCCDKTHLLSHQKYACPNKIMFVVRNIYVCRNKTFVVTNTCRNKHNFVMTKVLLQQAYFCCDKRMLVVTKDVFCHDKHVSQQK